jgi:hypothetical protein
MIEPNSLSEFIQVSLFAIFVWGTGIILGIVFVVKFVRDLNRKQIELKPLSPRFWGWLISIPVTSQIGITIAGKMSIFSPYPIMQMVLPCLLLSLVATVWYSIKPFPKYEWALVFFIFSPAIPFEVARRELKVENPHQGAPNALA